MKRSKEKDVYGDVGMFENWVPTSTIGNSLRPFPRQRLFQNLA